MKIDNSEWNNDFTAEAETKGMSCYLIRLFHTRFTKLFCLIRLLHTRLTKHCRLIRYALIFPLLHSIRRVVDDKEATLGMAEDRVDNAVIERGETW